VPNLTLRLILTYVSGIATIPLAQRLFGSCFLSFAGAGSHRDNLCRGCGKTIQSGRADCARCSIDDVTKNMLDAARIGRHTANSPEAQLKRASTQSKNALAQHAWKPSDQPAWLTEEFYSKKVQPILAALSASAIARQISVSRWYAGRVREGYRPHPRHWHALAVLAGVSV
jgi:hypothetical protein